MTNNFEVNNNAIQKLKKQSCYGITYSGGEFKYYYVVVIKLN